MRNQSSTRGEKTRGRRVAVQPSSSCVAGAAGRVGETTAGQILGASRRHEEPWIHREQVFPGRCAAHERLQIRDVAGVKGRRAAKGVSYELVVGASELVL